jgi:hypothetical protein
MGYNGTLCKTLFYDIIRQATVPVAIALVDASNYYNRIAHAMAFMIFQAFGVPTTATESMLGTIENMKFFLCTSFWRLESFCRRWYHHQNTRGLPRQWRFAGVVGGYQHLYPASTWEERPWCKISLPNHKITTSPICHFICGLYQPIAHRPHKR